MTRQCQRLRLVDLCRSRFSVAWVPSVSLSETDKVLAVWIILGAVTGGCLRLGGATFLIVDQDDSEENREHLDLCYLTWGAPAAGTELSSLGDFPLASCGTLDP